MFTKKNMAIVAALMLVGCSAFGMDQRCGSQVKELYAELLRMQGTDNPLYAKEIMVGHFNVNGKDYRSMASDAYISNQELFKNIFTAATEAKTGIMVQYKRLILNENQLSESTFFNFRHLQVIAHMQNEYGEGNPFALKKMGVLQVGTQPEGLIKIGSYINQQNQTLVITRYGFLNGIIDALVSLEADATASSNKNYISFCDALRQNLIKAIATASRQRLILLEDSVESSINIKTNLMKIKSFVNAVDQLGKVLKQ